MRVRETIVWFVVLTSCLSLLAGGGWVIQTPEGAVVIRVTDPVGAAVPGAQIRVVPAPELRGEKMETDSNGELHLKLKPGGYALFVTSTGFVSASSHIDVGAVEQTVNVVIKLQVGPTGSPVVIPISSVRDTLWISLYPFSQEVSLNREEFGRLPHKSVKVRNAHSDAEETYEGVPLAELLTRYGGPMGKELQGFLTYYILATGADGYQVVLSLAEVDPNFHPGEVLVADTLDGVPLDQNRGPFELVVTEDKVPSRWVRNLRFLQLKDGQQSVPAQEPKR